MHPPAGFFSDDLDQIMRLPGVIWNLITSNYWSNPTFPRAASQSINCYRLSTNQKRVWLFMEDCMATIWLRFNQTELIGRDRKQSIVLQPSAAFFGDDLDQITRLPGVIWDPSNVSNNQKNDLSFIEDCMATNRLRLDQTAKLPGVNWDPRDSCQLLIKSPLSCEQHIDRSIVFLAINHLENKSVIYGSLRVHHIHRIRSAGIENNRLFCIHQQHQSRWGNKQHIDR